MPLTSDPLRAAGAGWMPTLTDLRPTTTPEATRRHLEITGVGKATAIVVGFLVIVARVTDTSVRLGLACALGAAVLVDAWIARRSMREVTITILPDTTCAAGVSPGAVVEVVGLERPALLRSSLAGYDPDVRLLGPEVGAIALPRSPRGIAQSAVLDLITTGPLGLIRCGRRERLVYAQPIVVVPRLDPHNIAWPPMLARSFATDPTSLVGDELIRGIRPYVRGDSQRRVHWRATAHHGKLMVTEADGIGILTVRIAVELEHRAFGNEAAVARAAWLAREVLARGWRLELTTSQPRYLLAEDAPLASPFAKGFAMPLPIVRTLPPTSSVTKRITKRHQAQRLLATASPGVLELPRDSVLTRIVTADGDSWR